MAYTDGWQHIPSDIMDAAKDVGLEIRLDGTIQRKYPHKVSQPWSAKQKKVWSIFRKSCDCWNIQPHKLGVEPPDYGPRNRLWWFRDAFLKGVPVEWKYDVTKTIFEMRIHIGDTNIPGWPISAPAGIEKWAYFWLSRIPMKAAIDFDTWYVEDGHKVWINTVDVGTIPFNYKKRWFKGQRLTLPLDTPFRTGINMFRLHCRWKDPPGEWDDYMISDIRLKLMYEPWERKELKPTWGYYNYFMMHTLNQYFAGLEPTWCQTKITNDVSVSARYPDRNYGARPGMNLELHGQPWDYEARRLWLKTPGKGWKTLWLWIDDTYAEPEPMLEISIHDQMYTDFDAATLTWNNQPELGWVIVTANIPAGFTGWAPFDIGTASHICVKFTDETTKEYYNDYLISCVASENADVAHRPMYDIIPR